MWCPKVEAGDVVSESGSSHVVIWGGEASALNCPQLCMLPPVLTLIDLLTLLPILIFFILFSHGAGRLNGGLR